MKPNFPCRNLIVNTLYEFFEKDFVWSYYEKIIDGELMFDIPESNIKHYHSLFALFENEINQTIFSGNVNFIRTLFEDLKEQKIYLESLNRESVLSLIPKWNAEFYEEYLKKVEKKTEEYFSNETTKNLQHLQKYQAFLPINSSIFGTWMNVDKVYYAYYCIEEEFLKYIDKDKLDPYFDMLNKQIGMFIDFIDKYLKRYDAGEFFSKKQDETWFDVQVKRFKNNKIIGSILIIFLVLSSVFGLYKLMQDIFFPVKEKLTEKVLVLPETNINLKEFYTLDKTEIEYLQDKDSATWDWNTGTKTAGYYLTSFFNSYSGIKKDVDLTPGKYLCNSFNMQSVAAISGLNVFDPSRKQHDEVKQNYYNGTIKDGFAYYNPEIIKWAFKHLIPNSEEKNVQGFLFQNIYDELYRKNVRLLVESYLFFPDEKSYKVAQEDYLNAMKKPDFNGAAYLFRKYGKKDDCEFCFGYPIAIGFWLRRGIDGTNDEIWQGLAKTLQVYDKEWFNLKNVSDRTIFINQ